MSIISRIRVFRYGKLYRKHGFFWNSELAEFVRQYGGRRIDYGDPHMGFSMEANFCFPEIINGAPTPASACDYYVSTAKCLGEEVALVGSCGQGYVRLLLTEKGQFLGFDEYTLIRWGNADLNWRVSIQNFLNGTSPTVIGDVK